jgi:hypothetical protein
MDARLSHALVAVGAIAFTFAGWAVYAAVADAVGMIAGDGKEHAQVVRAEGDGEEKDDRRGDRKGDGRGEGKGEGRAGSPNDPKVRAAEGLAVDPGAHIAPPLGTSGLDIEPGPRGDGNARVAERAAERGLTPHELREIRAEKQGMSVDELKARKEHRADWREDQPQEALIARKESRQARHAELSPEAQAELEAQREARKELLEQDPTLGDAAQVLKQLQELGQQGDER